jgi:hypothetical protein
MAGERGATKYEEADASPAWWVPRAAELEGWGVSRAVVYRSPRWCVIVRAASRGAHCR